MSFSKFVFFAAVIIFYPVCATIAQKIPSQPHLQFVKVLNPIWKNLENQTDTIPIYNTDSKKLVLFNTFILDSLQANLGLFFLGIVGKCEVYVNQALIWKGEDKYGKLLVNLPYSNLKKINVVQLQLYDKNNIKENLIGLLQNVYLVKAAPERASLTPPRYSSYKDTVALLYPYSYFEGLKSNKTLLHRQLRELKQNGIHNIKFMLPPPEYAYRICDSLDIFIIDNTENTLHTFYFNTVPPVLKKNLLEQSAWYNDSYTKTKYYLSLYRTYVYIPSDITYNIKINLWLLSCILIGYLVFLKVTFRDIISDFLDWFSRYRLIMETVKNKRLIPSLWVALLNFFYWMIAAAVWIYIIAEQTYTDRPYVRDNLYNLLQENLIWIFLLWLILTIFFGIIHLIVGIFVSGVSQLYGKGKVFSRVTEISLINHFPILYFVVAILFMLPLSQSILEYVAWFMLYTILLIWAILRIYRMYKFGTKALKLHDIVIILYLCGAELLPYFLLGFYIFKF